ncbi:unnamed protein product [Ilex paraguariensis]|uniref:Uncharacterized protein n=1 Tax=Ilex paraguariensis TaxID=185542 RepID=A0ABC8RQX9_9AQUA
MVYFNTYGVNNTGRNGESKTGEITTGEMERGPPECTSSSDLASSSEKMGACDWMADDDHKRSERKMGYDRQRGSDRGL